MDAHKSQKNPYLRCRAASPASAIKLSVAVAGSGTDGVAEVVAFRAISLTVMSAPRLNPPSTAALLQANTNI